MVKCLEHTRESVGPCMWCGKKLCDKCIAHQEGRKLYCEKCAQQLNPISKIKISETKTQQTLKKGETQWI